MEPQRAVASPREGPQLLNVAGTLRRLRPEFIILNFEY